jgi:hypothetical protein
MSTQSAVLSPPEPAADPQDRLRGEISALVPHCASRQAFFSQALKHLAVYFDSPFAAICVQYSADVIEDQCHRGSTDPSFWRAPVQEFLTTAIGSGHPRAKLLSARHSSLQLGLIAVPLLDGDGSAIGGLSLVAKMGEQEVRGHVAVLESVCGFMMQLAREMERPASAGTSAPALGNRVLPKAAACESAEELAFSIVNSVRNSLGCQQVAIGLVCGQTVRLLAVSGQEDVCRQSPGTIVIQQAMEECLDFGQAILLQDPVASGGPAGQPAGQRLHRQWQHQARNVPVASIPLKSGERCVAVLSLQYRADSQLNAGMIRQLTESVEPFAPALLLLQRSTRGLARHAWETIIETWLQVIRPKGYARLAARVIAAGLLAWLCLGKLDYRVAATAIVQPAELRHVGAPYEAVLASAERIAGDRVRAGDVLCRLDTRELELQRAERLAELGVAEQEVQRAKVGKTPADARLAEMEAKLIRAQLATIENRIRQAVIRSPIDGLLVEGDLRTRVGGVLAQGTPLFQVAPATGWIVEVHVPGSAVSEIRPGQAGRFASQARPEAAQDLRLSRVQPSSVVKEKQAVFVGEAEILNPGPWLRPGMEGVAKIDTGPHRAWWVLFHAVTDYVRMNLWL